MGEPIIIWVDHIEEGYGSCSLFIWLGEGCNDSCSCVKLGLILEDGLEQRYNYGYVVPFRWEFR